MRSASGGENRRKSTSTLSGSVSPLLGGQVRARRSLRDHQPPLLFILLESSWFAQHISSPFGRHYFVRNRCCEVDINVGTEDTVQTRESSRRTSRAWTAPYFEGGGVYTGGADDDGGGW